MRLPRIARPRALVGFIALVAVIGGSGFIAGKTATPSSVGSDAIASAAPPKVTAEVDRRVLDTPAQVQGTVQTGDLLTVPFSGLAGDGVLPVVTQVGVTAGGVVENGSLLIAVAGQPRIALRVTAPLYRHLHVGDVGDDVLGFETALAAAGGAGFDVDESFTANTLEAADDLWSDLGYRLPTEVSAVPASTMTSAPVPTPSAPPDPLSSVVPERFVDVTQVVQLPTDTVSVASIAAVGETVGSDRPLVVLQTSANRIGIRVAVLDEDAFAVGSAVTLRAAGMPDQTATIAHLGDFTPADGTSGAVAGRDAHIDVPAEWSTVKNGEKVIVTQASIGVEVLAVPLSAVHDASGKPYVVVDHATGLETGAHVSVSLGTVGDGWVEIPPDVGLAPGDVIEVTP